MIPHRIMSSETFADDLKDRVTACRKRLRFNRTHRVHLSNQVGELFCEIAIEGSHGCDHSEEDSVLRESLVHALAGETSQRANENENSENNKHSDQEVGIT
jgi:hypothetical protein